MYYIKAKLISIVSGRTIADLQIAISPNAKDAEETVELYSADKRHTFSYTLERLQKTYGNQFGIATGIVYYKEKMDI